MAAAAAALALGLAARRGRATGCASFAGVPHRLEQVAEIDGVLYVNDSKATNVAAAAAALASFDGGVHAILGGSLKGGELRAAGAEPVARALRRLLPDRRGRRRSSARDLAPAGEAGVELHRCGDLERRGRAGRRGDAQPGEVVLLSPACASFDAFRDFEERGERFRALVEELAMSGVAASARHAAVARRRPRREARQAPPLEYTMLLTATLCLLAFGAVMVFSASSTHVAARRAATALYYLKRTLMFGAIGLLRRCSCCRSQRARDGRGG